MINPQAEPPDQYELLQFAQGKWRLRFMFVMAIIRGHI